MSLYIKKTEFCCKICGWQMKDTERAGKAFSDHLRRQHGLSSQEYTVRHLHNGVRPTCPICGGETRYLSFGFRKYCSEHQKCAMQEGGRGELSSPNGAAAAAMIMVKPITAKEKIPKTTDRSWEDLYTEWRTFIRKQHRETFTKDGTQFSDCGKWAYRLIDIRKNVDRTELSNLYTALGDIGCRLTVYTSDEWREKGDICRQQIGHILGGSTVRIGARQCQIRQLTTAERRDVFTKYHIQGDTSAKVAYGLISGGEIVGAVSGRVPVQKKWGHVLEIARMVFKSGYSVMGGASRLIRALEVWAKLNCFSGVISYAELRYGTGDVYGKCGYQKVAVTGQNYWYSDGVSRYDRFAFRAGDGRSEAQCALEHGVHPVWGIGNAVYMKQF